MIMITIILVYLKVILKMKPPLRSKKNLKKLRIIPWKLAFLRKKVCIHNVLSYMYVEQYVHACTFLYMY